MLSIDEGGGERGQNQMRFEEVSSCGQTKLVEVVLEEATILHVMYTKILMFVRSMPLEAWRSEDNFYFPKSDLTVCVKGLDWSDSSRKCTVYIMSDNFLAEAFVAISPYSKDLDVIDFKVFTIGVSDDGGAIHSMCEFIVRLGSGVDEIWKK